MLPGCRRQVHEFGTEASANADGGLPPIVQEDVVTITPVMLQPTQRSGADHVCSPSNIANVRVPYRC